MNDYLIESLLREYILKELAAGSNVPTIDYETKLIESGILDSLSILKLVTFIEGRFGIRVSPNAVVPDNFQTISALGNFIRTKKYRDSSP